MNHALLCFLILGPLVGAAFTFGRCMRRIYRKEWDEQRARHRRELAEIHRLHHRENRLLSRAKANEISRSSFLD